jgi:hypothetical protein
MKASLSSLKAKKHFNTFPRLSHVTFACYKTFPYSASISDKERLALGMT